MIDYSKYDIVHCGISGGKDSQAAATWLVQDSGCPAGKVRLSFCDTGNEHEWTYEHIRQIEKWLETPIEWLKPELDFYQLAEKEKRFPSAKARFCTKHLKMEVTQNHLLTWMKEGANVLLVTGVRRAESAARSKLAEFDFDTYYACDVYRPLIDWSLEQVIEYLKSKGQYPNPLYGVGAQRVGCFPCVMSRKHEIRMVADKFPDRIDLIREAEIRIGASFFSINYVPKRFRRTVFSRNGESWRVASIDDVVDWSHTGAGGREYDSGPQMRFWEEEAPTCANTSGACE